MILVPTKDLDLPPTTPPAMAPVLDDFDLEDGDGNGDPVADDVLVDAGAVDSGASADWSIRGLIC